MNTITATLKHTKSTKGTHVYVDDSADAPVKTLYIQKEATPTNPPAAIKITIEESNDA